MPSNKDVLDISQFPVPVLGFAAFSGTGKTTLLCQLIPILNERGLRLAVVKHSHHDIEMDKPGKDSYQLRQAGASQLVLAGKKRSICFVEQQQVSDRSLSKQLNLLDSSSLDLVLVEGYRDEAFPKIELHRQQLGKPLLYPNDENIIALVSDIKLEKVSLTQFQFHQLDELATFICNGVQSNRL